MKRLFFTALIVSAAVTWLFFKGEPPIRPNADDTLGVVPVVAGRSSDAKAQTPVEVLNSQLASLPNWTPEGASAVAEALQPCAERLLTNRSWMNQVQSIRMDGSVPKLLATYPASISLLIMTNADARASLAEGILSGSDATAQDLLLSSCAKYVDSTSLSLWAQALKAHGPTIARLLRICPTWPIDGIFSVGRDGAGNSKTQEAIRLYDGWVANALSQVPENELPSMIQFLIGVSPTICARLRDDAQFRNQFDDTWEKFRGCVRETQIQFGGTPVWHCFGDDVRLWDLLMRKNGKDLFMNAGSLATRMLLGSHAVHETKGQERVERLLLAQYAEIYNAMEHLGENSAFVSLITRDALTDDQVAIACSRLNQARQKNPTGGDVELLNKWMSLADDAELKHAATGSEPPNCLRKVVGYSFINALIKLADGRKLTVVDAANIIKDVYRIKETIATGGATFVAGVGAFVEQAAKDFAAGLAQDALEYAPELTAEARDGKGSSRLAIYGALTLQPDEIKRRLQLNEAMDVTKATQAASQSNPGSVVFEKCQKMGAQFKLAAPSTHLIVSTNGPVASEDPLAGCVRETASKAEKEPSNSLAWQQNLGAWWLYAWSLN